MDNVNLQQGEYLVAVYGSLRKGLGNHGFLSNSELVSKLLVSGCIMYSGRAFPYVCYSGNNEDVVLVEVYKINYNTLRALDGLEGISFKNDETGHYMRRKLGNSEIWMYFSCDDQEGKLSRVPNLSELYPSDEQFNNMDFADWTIYKKKFIDAKIPITQNEVYTEYSEYDDDVPMEGIDEDQSTLGEIYSDEAILASIGESDVKKLYEYAVALDAQEKKLDVEFEEWKKLFILQVREFTSMADLMHVVDQCLSEYKQMKPDVIGDTNDEYPAILKLKYKKEYESMCNMSVYELETLFRTFGGVSECDEEESIQSKEMQDLVSIVLELKQATPEKTTDSGDPEFDRRANLIRKNISKRPFASIKEIYDNPTASWHHKFNHVIASIYEEAEEKEIKRMILVLQDRIRKHLVNEKVNLIPKAFEILHDLSIDELMNFDLDFQDTIETIETSLAN